MIVILSADTLAAEGGGVNPGNSIAFYRGTSLPERMRLKVWCPGIIGHLLIRQQCDIPKA